MELTKTDNRIAPNLDKEERQFIEAKFSQHPKDLKDAEFKNFMLVLIGKAHVTSGQNADNQLINLSIPDLLDTISKYFSTLTLKEIELSFKLGLMGELGEYFGLNNKTYFGWFKNLIGSQKRTEANRKQGAYTNTQNAPKALTDEEKRAIMVKASLEAFESVRKGQYFPDMGNAVYNFIDRNWKIPFNAERKRKYITEAKVKLIAEHSEKIGTSNPEKAKKLKEEIGKIHAGLCDEPILCEAKRLVLNAYFKELIEFGTELKTIIN